MTHLIHQTGYKSGMPIDLPDATWAAVLQGWRDDAEFRTAFSHRLAEHPAPAIAWETCPVTRDRLDRPYADVIIESPALARVRADEGAFAEHFASANDGVCTFTNLGGDAVLVAPAPGPEARPYPHLAAFVRTAPAEQIDALWIAVARALQDRLDSRPDPVWVSTAGLGVHWLHVRLDDRPKYYRHAPFRAPPA